MARKDDIFNILLEHELLKNKYSITDEIKPKNIREGLNSQIPIIKAIALIIENSEAGISDSILRNTITQYLNEAAI